MNTPENTTPITTPTAARPLGLWLKVIDHRLSEAMRELFAEYGIGRRDWRRLNVIARGVGGGQMLARLAARPEKTESLRERGWVTGESDEPGTWSLTPEGERVYAELLEKVTALRGRVAGAVSPEDFATTLATLEAIARELGWNEGERMPRGFGRRGGDSHSRGGHGRGGRDDRSHRGHGGHGGHGRRGQREYRGADGQCGDHAHEHSLGHGRSERSLGRPTADPAS